MALIYFITGTDTGVGKTVLTALLARHLRARGVRVLAVKPFCSGGRGDARILRRAQDNEVTLDEINPWHFRAPLAPVLAARRERCQVAKSDVLRYLRACADKCELLLIEGAGGLLSPLGEGFDARDLILKLTATPIIVCPNRLGTVNQVRLVLASMSVTSRNSATVVLVEPRCKSLASRSNPALLGKFIARHCLLRLPAIDWPNALLTPNLPRSVVGVFQRIAAKNCNVKRRLPD